jgi:hypothetical protein
MMNLTKYRLFLLIGWVFSFSNAVLFILKEKIIAGSIKQRMNRTIDTVNKNESVKSVSYAYPPSILTHFPSP